jgi:predicted MPP superfamily phosphohydrolase
VARISRRALLGSIKLGGLAALGVSSYAFGVEPCYRLVVTTYRLTPPGWPLGGRPLRLAVLADLHACEVWMPLSRIQEIVARTNALQPDIVLLLGDYMAGLQRVRALLGTGEVPASDWGRALGALQAPLGVHAVLGNHEWWEDVDAAREALTSNRIPVMENDVRRIERADGPAFWLAGLGDQLAKVVRPGTYEGVDDLPGTLAKVGDDAPVILMAHEPDIFPQVTARVSLTLSGHTHGGQVALPLVGRPVVPSAYGERFAYGHIVEQGRHLIVSGGLGCSMLPVRLGVPPEIVLIELGGGAQALAAS